MVYKIIISQRGLDELESAIGFYSRNKSSATVFYKAYKNALSILGINPFFQKRYKNVRGLPISKHPYMILFTVDKANKVVEIRSIFNTFLNPNKYPSVELE